MLTSLCYIAQHIRVTFRNVFYLDLAMNMNLILRRINTLGLFRAKAMYIFFLDKINPSDVENRHSAPPKAIFF